MDHKLDCNSCIEDLESLCDILMFPFDAANEETLLKNIYDKYDIPHKVLDAMALLYEKHVALICKNECADILSMSPDDSVEVMEYLCDKGLVSEYYDSYYIFYHNFTKLMMRDVVNDTPADIVQYNEFKSYFNNADFISLLNKCHHIILTAFDAEQILRAVRLMDTTTRQHLEHSSCQSYLDLTHGEYLSDFEKAILIYAAGQFAKAGLTPCTHLCGLSCSEVENEGRKALINKGLLELGSIGTDDESHNKQSYIISPSVCRTLFEGYGELVSYDDICRNSTIVKCESIRHKELYYDDIETDVKELRELVSVEKFDEVSLRLRERGMKGGIACMLYGASGTGKTELVRQLARDSGRDMVMADASKLYASEWGRSEKNFREFFRSLKYISALTSAAPIVLIDEADSIFGKRLEVRYGIDKSENSVQSILLQEIEAFEGILIATTNLAENIDPAFERRFIYKIGFCAPSAEVRARIWKAHLPDISDEDASVLAVTYPLSGGHIDNVARKCEIRYVLRGEWPEINAIKNFCDLEVKEVMNATQNKRFKGFREYSINY